MQLINLLDKLILQFYYTKLHNYQAIYNYNYWTIPFFHFIARNYFVFPFPTGHDLYLDQHYLNGGVYSVEEGQVVRKEEEGREETKL